MDDLPSPFRLARNAKNYSNYKIKMGAVLVDSGTPIAVGFNSLKYFSKWCSPPSVSIHAEMNCLRTCSKKRIKGCELYIYREHKNGRLALAKPCEDCLNVIRQKGIKRIYYTTESGYEVMDI